MKFGKELDAQMVQEWQEAYMDYNELKLLLKDILHYKTTRNKNAASFAPAEPAAAPTGSPPDPSHTLKRRVSLYRAFSGLTNRARNSPRKGYEEEVILVSSEEGDGGAGNYKTTFLNAAEEGGEFESAFFRKLDMEFNKVNDFYKTRVDEEVKEAEDLSKQMNALIALRIKVENPVVNGGRMSELIFSNGGSSAPEPVVHPYNGGNPGQPRVEVGQKLEIISESYNEEENSTDDGSRHSGSHRDSGVGEVTREGFRPAPLEILDHVKLNVQPETPVSTMKNLILSSKLDLSYSKEELQKSEQLMSQAFIEFYNKLRLLKSYCFLNQLAFSKILKKYDKITSRNVSKVYVKMMENSYLGSSDEVSKLMESVEATYVKHFANGNHRKGMQSLRPLAKRERHRTTFSLGFFTGCAAALLVGIILIINLRGIYNSKGAPQYMENIFPLYSLLGFIVLHLILYAGNIYFWKRYRINYPFIFGFKRGTALGYREVLLVSAALAVLTLMGIISNLEMEMDPSTQSFQEITELVPLCLLVLVALITFCPFNIMYKSSRMFLLQTVLHCLFAPFYKVSLPDFFLADQLTSQVQALRNLEFYVCYYGWGDFKRRQNTCRTSNVYQFFYFVIAIVPYWFRFLQCMRRLFEEKDKTQGFNALRYLSAIVAVAFRTSYDFRKGWTLRIVAAATSTFATVFSIYWDLVKDWGLLQRDSVNPWLRDKLAVPYKSVYFAAMGLNIVLRLAWMQSVLDFTSLPFLHRTGLVAIVASLEIIRRGIWNFFRLENEHFNNVGKYRAFKSVPLPFFYDDDDEDDHKNA